MTITQMKRLYLDAFVVFYILTDVTITRTRRVTLQKILMYLTDISINTCNN